MTTLENSVSIYIGVCHKDNSRLLQNALCRECQRDVEIVNRAKRGVIMLSAACFGDSQELKGRQYSIAQP